MARKAITKVNATTNTVATQFSKFDEQWTPGWDKKPGADQAMSRVKTRVRMGTKLTPIGAGTLLKSKR
jgi:hypothetical protein